VSFGSASHAKDAAPERRSREGGQKPATARLRSLAETANTPTDPAKSSRLSRSLLRTVICCRRRSMAGIRRLVYVLKSASPTPQFYVGLTSDANARLADHNTGRCPHTASRRPWLLHVVIEFSDEQTAVRFERYLKSGSGRAFAKRHFEL
jgi:putative endonuclease